MKQRDAFELAVRIAGLLVLLIGIGELLSVLLGALTPQEARLLRSNATMGILETVAGFLLMRGMIPLTDVAFPKRNDSTPPPAA